MIIPSFSTYCSTNSPCTIPSNSGGANSCQRLANPGNTYCAKGSNAECPPYTWLLLLDRLNVVSEANSSSNVSTRPNLKVLAQSTTLPNDVQPAQPEESSGSVITSSSKNVCLPSCMKGGFVPPNSVALKRINAS